MSLIDLWRIRWPHFKPGEILSPDGAHLLNKMVFVMQEGALDTLERFRLYLNNKEKKEIRLLINHGDLHYRGFRSPKENFEVQKQKGGDGWAFSFHVAGCAFDVSSPELTPTVIYEYAKNSNLWNGIIRYKTWVHLDKRNVHNFYKILE